MKIFKLIVTSLNPIVLITAEVCLFWNDYDVQHPRLIWFLGLASVLLLLAVVLSRKGGSIFKQSVLFVLKGGAASIPGILLLIYFGIHLNLMTNQLSDFFEHNKSPTLIRFFTSASFLLNAFLIDTLQLPKLKKEGVEKERRKVLVTALSPNDPENLKKIVEKIVDQESAEQPIKKELEIPWNWGPIINILDVYKKVDEVVIIKSNRVREELKQAGRTAEGRDAFEEMLHQKYPGKTSEPVDVDDADVFDSYFPKLKTDLNQKLKTYKDEEIIFNISSGTSNITSALTFLSMPGKRGVAYQKQDSSKKLDEFTVGVLTIEELWDEIFEIYSRR